MLQLQPQLGELQKLGADLYIIAYGSERDLKAFFTENPMEATIIHDSQGSVFQQYGVYIFPTTLIVDLAGRVAYSHLGWTHTSYIDTILPAVTTLASE